MASKKKKKNKKKNGQKKKQHIGISGEKRRNRRQLAAKAEAAIGVAMAAAYQRRRWRRKWRNGVMAAWRNENGGGAENIMKKRGSYGGVGISGVMWHQWLAWHQRNSIEKRRNRLKSGSSALAENNRRRHQRPHGMA